MAMTKKTAVEIGEDLHRLIALNSGYDRLIALNSEYEEARTVTGRMRSRNTDWLSVDYGRQESRLASVMAPDSLYAAYIPGAWCMPDAWRPSVAGSVNAALAPSVPVDAPSRGTLVHVVAATEEELSLDDPRRHLAAECEALLGYGTLAREVKTPGRLRRVLAKLEIEILEEASVNAYKEQMVQHYASHKKMAQPTWRLTKLREYKQPVPEYVLQKAVSIKRELSEAEFYIDQLAVDPFLIVALTPIKDYVVNQPSRVLDPETQGYGEVWDEPKFEATL